MKEKVGLFICRCGDNIAGVVDVGALAKRVSGDGKVSFVAEHELLCSPDGKAFLTEKMKAEGATHAVIAACSPKDHEAEFQRSMEAAGINRYLMQMANIREHCTWVTRDREEALDKSVAMVKAALRRVRLHEVLTEKEITCNSDLLIVGAGVAGMEAALLAALAGRKVTLVEEGPSAGGRVVEFEEAAPTMECSPCMLSPRMDLLSNSEHISLITNAKVTEVLGYLGNYNVKIEKRARWVDPTLCIGCDECIKACPVSVPSEIQHGLGDRKAIYVPFPGSVPNCAIIDKESCVRFKGEACTACADACPMAAVNFDEQDETLAITCGAVILATGNEPYEPEAENPWRLGELPDVYTLSQYERLSSNHGPTGGTILKADGTPPRRIAVVHCVGREALGYCSGYCCEAALKVGILAAPDEAEKKAGVVGPEVVHLHSDLVSNGVLGAALLAKAKAKGAKLVKVKDMASVRVSLNGKGMMVDFANAAGKAETLDADMVVLAAGMKPSRGTAEMMRQLDLTANSAGYPVTDHPMIRPAQSGVEGVYLAGCSGPRRIAQSIAEAQAAIGAAMARVQPGRKLTLEVITAHTDEALCSKCLVCVSVCPYRACVYDEAADRVTVNEVLCHGCGTCVASCASGAAAARHFTDRQIGAEITEVLHG